MSNKPAYTINDQLAVLENRGMHFHDYDKVPVILKNISYYRLKGYWWDMQDDYHSHKFKPNTYFEDVIDRYNFDRELRLILFNAIEHIEIALRTKMIYHLSLSYGGLWYLNANLFDDTILYIDGARKMHSQTLDELKKEFNRSQEIFIKHQRNKYPTEDPDAWKILEVASMGVLSKLYKCLNHQLPEKAIIANEFGLSLHSELSSWLEAITYIRNIIAHHSRLWSRTMVKRPVCILNNPRGNWFINSLDSTQEKKPFLIISTMVYFCKYLSKDDALRTKILTLFDNWPEVPKYKLGFLNNWQNEPVWKL